MDSRGNVAKREFYYPFGGNNCSAFSALQTKVSLANIMRPACPIEQIPSSGLFPRLKPSSKLHIGADVVYRLAWRVETGMSNFVNMFKNLNDTAMQEYTPLFYAIAVPFFYYLLISLFQLSSWTPPRWMWHVGIAYLFAGVFLQILSKRLKLTQSFQTLGAACFTLLAWLLACLLFTEGLGPAARVLVVLAISFFAIGNIVHEYHSAARETEYLGYGTSGRLDAETGQLHPYKTPNQFEAVDGQPRQVQRSTLQIAALAAGLSSVLINVLSDRGVYWYIAFLVLGFLWLATLLFGRMIRRLLWVHSWEQEHRVTIFVVY